MVKLTTKNVKEYDNQWDGVLDTAYWTSTVVDTGTTGESNGWVYAQHGDPSDSATLTSNFDLKSIARLIYVPFSISAFNTSDAVNATSANAFFRIYGDSGDTLNRDVINLSTSVPGGANKWATGHYSGALIIQFEGGNMRLRIVGTNATSQGNGGSFTNTIISDNTVVDISSWNFVKIKLYSTCAGNGGAKSAPAKIGPILFCKTILGSKGTATDAS